MYTFPPNLTVPPITNIYGCYDIKSTILHVAHAVRQFQWELTTKASGGRNRQRERESERERERAGYLFQCYDLSSFVYYYNLLGKSVCELFPLCFNSHVYCVPIRKRPLSRCKRNCCPTNCLTFHSTDKFSLHASNFLGLLAI